MMAARPDGPLRVLGRYALYHEIAAGGMATVHIGRLLGPVGFARTVAIKRLHPQYAKDPEFASMFLDEARLAARVQHPNVVATIDVVATDGELFLIMDFVRGESLSRLVRTAKKLGEVVPPRIATSIMCGFLHGLHAAHEAKNERGELLSLVHRDVSPQNVLVGADGIARVLDFGIAKAAGRIQVTKDGQIKGKLAYMPPEQLTGREVSRAVDIYASAVVMWETLTGERLFRGETEGETLAKILHEPVPPPSAVEPRVPASFDAPLLRALSRDPAQRHATARELALELERCVGLASPTEVGEWVERICGEILSARESQVAAIESASAGLRVSPSGRPERTDSTDSDISAAPYRPAAAFAGPPSGMMPTAPTQTAPGVAPPSSRSARAATAREDTGSKATGTMSLPVDKRLPVLATGLGLLVLLGVVGYVLLGKTGPTPNVAPSATPTASEAASAAPAASSATTATGSGGAPVAEPTAPAPSSMGSAVASAMPASSAPATTTTTKSPPQHHVSPRQPPPPAAPTAKATATATTAPKKNCDPPYTIDEHGRRKYKLECM